MTEAQAVALAGTLTSQRSAEGLDPTILAVIKAMQEGSEEYAVLEFDEGDGSIMLHVNETITYEIAA